MVRERTTVKAGKLLPLTVTEFPGGPLSGLTFNVRSGMEWLPVSENEVPAMSALTVLVDGIGASRGTVKDAVNSPEALARADATSLVSRPEISYRMLIDGLAAAPGRVLLAGKPVPVTATVLPRRLVPGSTLRERLWKLTVVLAVRLPLSRMVTVWEPVVRVVLFIGIITVVSKFPEVVTFTGLP
jgi:hypothetical protein